MCVCVFVCLCICISTRSQKWIDRNMASFTNISTEPKVNPHLPKPNNLNIETHQPQNLAWFEPDAKIQDSSHYFFHQLFTCSLLNLLETNFNKIIRKRGRGNYVCSIENWYGNCQYVCIDWFCKCGCVAGPQINTQLYYQSNRTTRNVVFNFPPIKPCPHPPSLNSYVHANII